MMSRAELRTPSSSLSFPILSEGTSRYVINHIAYVPIIPGLFSSLSLSDPRNRCFYIMVLSSVKLSITITLLSKGERMIFELGII